MKRLLATLMILVLVLSAVVSAAGVDKTNVKPPQNEKITKQLALVEKFKEKSDEKFQIQFDEKNGNPRFVKGNLSDKPVKTAEEAAQYLESNKDLFKVTTGNFEVKKVSKDEIGMTHYRTAYTVDGITVYGGELIVHTDKDGNVTTINGSIDSSIPAKAWKNEIKLSAEKAIKAAEATLDFTPNANTYTAKPEAQAYLFKANNEWQPVYQVKLNFMTPYAANMVIFVNASNGQIVQSYNGIKEQQVTGTGIDSLGVTRSLNLEYENGKYKMIDKSRPTIISTATANYQQTVTNVPYVEDTDNVFNAADQKAAVSAQVNVLTIYDFWKNTFNRNSYDGNGTEIKSIVHYGNKFNNACWDGKYMEFGDGDGIDYKDFSGSLDVIAHEYAHAVDCYYANYAYVNQEGALCEHMADAFAYFVDDDDWTIGEDCTITKPAIRSIADPSSIPAAGLTMPDHMDEYQQYEFDNGGVHINVGIPNKALYNIATTLNDKNKLMQIYWRAETVYLWSNAQFMDFRNAIVQSADELYGSSVAQICHNGFLAVGLDPNAHDTFEPNERLVWAYPIESNQNYNSYISRVDDIDIYKLTATTAGPITVALTNLPGDYELYLLDANGTVLKSSESYGTANEIINHSTSAAGTYYVKVKPYTTGSGEDVRGYYSTTQTYTLRATYPTGAPLAPLTYEAQVIESAHNYASNLNETKTYTKAGAARVGVHFTKIETEKGYDYVKILDKNGNLVATYDGLLTDVYIEVPGDTIQIQLTSDSSVVKYGYQIDQVGYSMQ